MSDFLNMNTLLQEITHLDRDLSHKIINQDVQKFIEYPHPSGYRKSIYFINKSSYTLQELNTILNNIDREWENILSNHQSNYIQ